MRKFKVPDFYRSPIIATVKESRRILDPRKRDLSPSILDFGPVRFKLARHFGFCYGVENAIEIAYRALEENPGRRIFLLSEIIHNPHVNADLAKRGIRFLRTSEGVQIIPWSSLRSDDLVIVPAFGTTLEVQASLRARGIDPYLYDSTCPFVERVWNKSRQIGERGFTVVLHGKRFHEETRATFSQAKESAPVVVVRDLDETDQIVSYLRGDLSSDDFLEHFAANLSSGFDPDRDLVRVGVVNQTTMLASETGAISTMLRDAMIGRYGEDAIDQHFADTSDTLCYATNENQAATRALIADGGDLAIVVGGFNSSNTTHLVELCDEEMPTYFINAGNETLTQNEIQHFDLSSKEMTTTSGWLAPGNDAPIDIVLTAGASCPDALLDGVVNRIVSWFPDARPVEAVLLPFASPETV